MNLPVSIVAIVVVPLIVGGWLSLRSLRSQRLSKKTGVYPLGRGLYRVVIGSRQYLVVGGDIVVRGRVTFLLYTKGVRDITESRSIVGSAVVEDAIADEVLDRVRLYLRRQRGHSPRI